MEGARKSDFSRRVIAPRTKWRSSFSWFMLVMVGSLGQYFTVLPHRPLPEGEEDAALWAACAGLEAWTTMDAAVAACAGWKACTTIWGEGKEVALKGGVIS